MKKIIALIAAVAMVLTLAGCFGVGNNSDSTADEANAPDVSTYNKDFDGLKSYISDRVSSTKQDIYYDVLGAKDGIRFVINNNPFVEVYDFSNIVATPDSGPSAHPDKAKDILDSVKKNGKFTPLDGGVELTAVVTDSGKYVLAWDESRSYKYKEKIATDELIENW